MEASNLTQLGVSGVVLAILFFIVRWFVQHITTKDQRLYDITEKFNETVSNHIDHSTKAMEKLGEQLLSMRGSLDTNNKIVNRLYKKLYDKKK